ncbi:MAG: cell division protein ZapB [Denitrovibrio sp.]|nr:MAG: cell division protein ZapB [Denitrovibrio sp.]
MDELLVRLNEEQDENLRLSQENKTLREENRRLSEQKEAVRDKVENLLGRL